MFMVLTVSTRMIVLLELLRIAWVAIQVLVLFHVATFPDQLLVECTTDRAVFEMCLHQIYTADVD